MTNERPDRIPPADWFSPGRRVTAKEYRAWLEGQDMPAARRSKFNANNGHRKDLGHYLKSSLEANTLRLLLFTGYTLWRDKGADPPATGKYVRYEARKFKLLTKRGTAEERPLFYLPDFELWEGGRLVRLWEAKGYLDPRSKRLLRLMAEQHPEAPVELITAQVLDGLALEAMREDRRQGGSGQIPGWE